VHELLGLTRGRRHGGDVAVPRDGEAGDRLAGLGDAVDHLLGPALLDADHHHGAHVGVPAGADDGAEVEVEVLAELQPPVGVGQGDGALDVVGHGLGRGVGDVVHRQDGHVVADADAAVLAAVGPDLPVRGHLTNAWS
jgi:hypothetical protein